MDALSPWCPRCGLTSTPANPRHQDVCVRCGRKVLTPRVTQVQHAGSGPHSPPTGDVARNVTLERAFTREAARAVGVDPEGIIAFSEQRILPGPLRDAATRDMIQETREELSDARNYLCWRAQILVESGDAEHLPEIGRVLSGLLRLWHDLDSLG